VVESMMRWVVSAEMSRVPADEAQLRGETAPAEKPVECPAAAAPLNIPYSAAPPRRRRASPSASDAPASEGSALAGLQLVRDRWATSEIERPRSSASLQRVASDTDSPLSVRERRAPVDHGDARALARRPTPVVHQVPSDSPSVYQTA
jgi:hypothetical protein